MEQRIGSSSQPLEGAGFDPAFVPGLTAPVAAGEPEDAKPAAEEAAKAEPEREPEVPAEPVADAAEAAEEDAEQDETPDGPVFEAFDRRAKIVADHRGVRLSLDEEACEFRWEEIGAVETETPRFGKRYTITVHTPDRRWYPIEIEATSRNRFKEWDEQLDAVLDAYFDEGDDEDDEFDEFDEVAQAVAEGETTEADKAGKDAEATDGDKADKAD